MTSTKTLLIAGLATLAIGCSAAQDKTTQDAINVVSQKASAPQIDPTQSHKQQAPHVAHTKLSAAIDFNTEFSGRANVGVTETLNINVTSRYPGSSVAYEILPSPGLQIFQNNGMTETTRSLSESGHDLSLQFQPLIEGAHSVTILAKVTMADGQYMTRSHSIPVYVGEKFRPTKNLVTPVAPSDMPTEVGGMVIMDAEETIE